METLKFKKGLKSKLKLKLNIYIGKYSYVPNGTMKLEIVVHGEKPCNTQRCYTPKI